MKSRLLGTLLICLSGIGFIVIFLPFFLSFLPPGNKSTAGYTYSIDIPKINAVSPIIPGVDPWNREEYTRALRFGVAQAKGTALPGEHGTIYLFAHSSGMPWEILGTNIPFLRLGELKIGDEISLYAQGKRFRYTVSSKKVVAALDTAFLSMAKHDEVILQTCWPIGTDWERLLVYALPHNPE